MWTTIVTTWRLMNGNRKRRRPQPRWRDEMKYTNIGEESIGTQGKQHGIIMLRILSSSG